MRAGLTNSGTRERCARVPGVVRLVVLLERQVAGAGGPQGLLELVTLSEGSAGLAWRGEGFGLRVGQVGRVSLAVPSGCL